MDKVIKDFESMIKEVSKYILHVSEKIPKEYLWDVLFMATISTNIKGFGMVYLKGDDTSKIFGVCYGTKGPVSVTMKNGKIIYNREELLNLISEIPPYHLKDILDPSNYIKVLEKAIKRSMEVFGFVY